MKKHPLPFQCPHPFSLVCVLLLASASLSHTSAADQPPQPGLVLPLWKDLNTPPGDEQWAAAREDNQPALEQSWQRVTQIDQPELWIYQPEESAPGRPAVLVCPGGGYNALAFEHEGTMVAEWLNRHGITAILLRYRVPRRSQQTPHEIPLKDARRAMGLVRHHAGDWGISPDRIGALGFSAGADLALRLSLASGERDYPAHEKFDAADTRPDFLVLVYPAYQIDPQNPGNLRGDLEFSRAPPPAFFVHGHEDQHPASASALLYLKWHAAGVPAGLHIFARGGHGFGMRPGDQPVHQWPQRCMEWIDSMGWRNAP